MDNIKPTRTLRFIIIDPAPFYFMQEPCERRSVKIELTDEQLQRLELRKTGTNCGKPVYENISAIFLDDAD
jgi:hypothetical protein